MEAVAERAGVSRPLVYKHFANRDELVAAASRREAAELHLDLAMEVAASSSVEDMSRALLRGSLRATVERGQIFNALRAAGGWNRDIRREQRSRDRGRFGPSQRWRLASMARSAGVPSLSPPSRWVRSMRSSRNGASTRQRTTRGSSRRRISRWWSARIQWSLQAVAPATRHTYRTLANNFSQANRRVRESAVDPSDSKGGP